MIFFPDLETHKTRMGLLIPPGVSLAWLMTDDEVRESSDPELWHFRFDRRRIENFVGDLAEDDDVIFWGFRIAYDIAVFMREFPDLTVPLFDKYNAGLVRDIRIRGRLHDIREGTLDYGFTGQGDVSKLAGHKVTKYSLEGMAVRLVPGYMPHKNEWQTRFGELLDVRVSNWPEEPRKYALADPVVHRDVCRALPHEEAREAEECRAAFALHLSAAHGMRVDPQAVFKLKRYYQAQAHDAAEELHELGLLRLKPDGKVGECQAEIRAFVEEAFEQLHNESAPRTNPSTRHVNGQTKTSRAVLQQVGGYRGVKELLEFKQASKMLSTFLPPVEKAARAGVAVTPSIEPLINSGRPSCARPNLYNPPKKGGYRSLFVPPPGYKKVMADYEGAELHGFAQTCLDFGIPSTMAEVINSGGDVHSKMTAELLGMPYADTLKLFKTYSYLKDAGREAEITEAMRKVGRTRSPLAKAAVFGGLGGLGAPTFIEFCWSWSLFLTMREAKSALWSLRQAFPEIAVYFEVVDLMVKQGGRYTEERSGFTRGRLRFTQMANTHFQSPIAMGAKDGLWLVTYAQYCVSDSPLYNSRTALFLYDEIQLDVPEEQVEAAAKELPILMCAAMDEFVPDVPSKAEAVILDRWKDK
jgi:hypothetical protein